MTTTKVNLNIVSQRAAWIKEMIEALQDLIALQTACAYVLLNVCIEV